MLRLWSRRVEIGAGTIAAAALLLGSSPVIAQGRCPDDGLVPSADNLDRVEAAILCVINRERSTAGRRPLDRAPKLDLSARFHTATMIRRRFLGHEMPGHPSLLARIRGYGYFAGTIGGIYAENVGAGPTTNGTARALIEAWMASPGHRQNIMHPPFRDIGITAAPAPPAPAFFASYPSTVYTTDFGTHYFAHRRSSRRRCVRRRGTTRPRSGPAAPRRRYCRRLPTRR